MEQSTNDLYALCMARGAFKENEIGEIVLTLLRQLKQLHAGGIYMYLINP